jgi:TonB-dependent SusC/RagA subfamily outer membrane receptor
MSIRLMVMRVTPGIALGLMVATIASCTPAPGKPLQTPPAPEGSTDGYGERPKEAGGSIQTVKYQDQNKVAVSRVEEMLIGRFSGVDVIRTGDGGYSVSIRGTGSFMSNEQPLWVVDGVPFETLPGRGLSWINPQDVTKIDVLKSSAETAIYGVRGGNGVIVITTKKPR